jgi:flavin-dependent thymidylate synthase
MKNNTVELLGYYGDDKIHACSAWTSTSRDLSEDKVTRIPKLLTMLATEGHHTPFEKSLLHFLVTTDIASHIHIIKHRIGVSVNGESARYKEIKEDQYLIPNDWPEIWKEKLKYYTEEGLNLYHECVQSLTENYNIDRKRAKESARFFRPYNTQITADVSFNWRSFYHFQSLRNKPNAQLEIREIAQTMLDLVKNIEGNPFQHTISAFNL